MPANAPTPSRRSSGCDSASALVGVTLSGKESPSQLNAITATTTADANRSALVEPHALVRGFERTKALSPAMTCACRFSGLAGLCPTRRSLFSLRGLGL